ncbi:glycoside hydrolase family 3 protein [Ascidiimonas aurantiaca]|uniref:glycoside hydrolase family 3 protein n=1 Tax=Ascidiimonas aurantiaca TaxID=1685432 RepID=UPI0030ED2DB2
MIVEKHTQKFINKWSLEEQAGQLFFPAAFINGDDSEVKRIETLIKDYHIGGLTFFHSRISAATNFEGKKQVVRNEYSYDRLRELIEHYQSISSTPLLMSIDAEWGLAMRIENTPQYPYALSLGALGENRETLIFETAKYIGRDLKESGIHLNLAPVADINENPNNPVIGYRSFGQKKDAVSRNAIAFYKGLVKAGISGCFKHFPGHGNTHVDSHLGLPVIHKSKEQLMLNELVPFIRAIEEKADCIMIGHLAVPALSMGKIIPATLSEEIIKGVLRETLGFKGVVISDALNMRSISDIYKEKGLLEWNAFNAGNDILCFSENVEAGIEMIAQKSDKQSLHESVSRILALKEKVGLLKEDVKKHSLRTPFELFESSRLKSKLARNSITLIKNTATEIPVFQKHKKYTKLSFGKHAGNFFFKTLNTAYKTPEYEWIFTEKSNENEVLLKSIPSDHTLIIALFPPSLKPQNNFGFSDDILHTLSTIFRSHTCVLALFGNPYVLGILPNLKEVDTILSCYQDFPEFKEAAAECLLGKFDPIGKLPVTIHSIKDI